MIPLPRWWPYAAAALIVAVLAAVMWALRPTPVPPDVAAAEREREVQLVRDTRQDSLLAALVIRTAQVERENVELRERAAMATAIGQQERRRGAAALDSARRLVASADTGAAIAQYEAALAAKSAEADSAWSVAATERQRADGAVALANAWRETADTLRADRDRWRAIADEERAIRLRLEAATKCRILGLADCPTRTTTALLATAGGAAGLEILQAIFSKD